MVEITWLGHATFQFRLDSGEVIVMDPWVDGNPKYPKDHQFSRIDAILVSHAHFDHIHDAVPLAKKFKPKVVAIYETCVWLTSKGVENCSGMNKGGTQDVGPLKVTMTHAIHSCGIQDGDQIIYGGEAAGYVLHLALKGWAHHLLLRRHGGFLRYAAHREAVPSRPGVPADRRFLHYGTSGSRPCLPSAEAQESHPDALGTFPALTGTPDEVAALLKDFPQCEIWPVEIGKPVKW
jgi:hypothetical protein